MGYTPPASPRQKPRKPRPATIRFVDKCPACHESAGEWFFSERGSSTFHVKTRCAKCRHVWDQYTKNAPPFDAAAAGATGDCTVLGGATHTLDPRLTIPAPPPPNKAVTCSGTVADGGYALKIDVDSSEAAEKIRRALDAQWKTLREIRRENQMHSPGWIRRLWRSFVGFFGVSIPWSAPGSVDTLFNLAAYPYCPACRLYDKRREATYCAECGARIREFARAEWLCRERIPYLPIPEAPPPPPPPSVVEPTARVEL